MIDHQPEAFIITTFVSEKAPSFSVAISMGIPRSPIGAMFMKIFNGTLAANHGYPEPRKSPAFQLLWDVSQNWNTKELGIPNENLYSDIILYKKKFGSGTCYILPKMFYGGEQQRMRKFGMCGEAPVPAA